MKQKCGIMGLAVLALLCVMCSGQRAAGVEEGIGRVLRLVVRGLNDHIPVYTETAGTQVYADTGSAEAASVRVYADTGNAAETGAPVYADTGNAAEAGAQVYTDTGNVAEAGAQVYAETEARTGELSAGCALDVPELLQLPELPTGCEVTALAMALNYDGIELDKTEIADRFLIYNREDDNMARGYVGDPFSEEGAGCFAPAIQKTAERIFEERQIDANACDISGTELRDLLVYLDAGRPVIAWTTMYMEAPEFTEVSARWQGRVYRWYRQEHCVVLSGYDLSARTLQVNDPLEGIVQRDMDAFRKIYDQTGQNAVVLYIKS